jgi:hypothetical protein
MRRYAAAPLLAGAFLFLLSCNPLLGPLPSGMVAAAMVQHVPYSGTFTYSVDPGSAPRDVYFVFTNPSLSQDAASIPTVSGSISVDGKGIPAPASQPLPSTNSAPQSFTDRIAEFNRNPKAYVTQPSITGPSAQTVSPAGSDQLNVSAGKFYIAVANPDGSSSLVYLNATCRAKVGPLTFADGRTRTLSILVEDNSWNTGETTLPMVTALANRFLQNPESISPGDIYHWDTSVVGEPWGPQNDPNLIAWDTKNTVTILLTHLNSSYSGAVVVGYFWAKDNFASGAISYSNQRIMFYIDSYLYSTVVTAPPYNESTWAQTNYWPRIVFSTLAHEFQHMIQFYQKQVLRGAGSMATGTDTWINEMCSMLMEDLVSSSDKLNVEGPRGVSPTDGSAGAAGNTLGRIPYFNASSNASLAVAGSGFGLTQYSVTYAFGAWLIRNYGGPALLTRIVQCPQTDSTAVVNAAAAHSGRTESMQDLLERWAASVLISDNTSAPFGYRYNTGGWTSFSEGSETFNLGSLDVFNYSPTLTVYSGSVPIPAAPYYSSNIYYKAAAALAGQRTFTVSLPAGTVMSVVLK